MKFSLSSLKQVQPILSFKRKLGVDIQFLRPKDKVVFVMGATGTGKSRLAIDLATRFPAEIINSDKIQVHKGLDVVTNKVTPQECRGIPHHLLGIIDPNANFTSTDFSCLASQVIASITAKDRLPIVAGGANSYIESLVTRSAEFLLNYQCCFIWVDVSLPVLNSFVSKRVDKMVETGLVDEVREMFDPKADYSVGIRRAIGVPELHEYFVSESLIDRGTQRKMLALAVNNIKQNTEILACRQLQKIHRLYNKRNWCMHRIDATEVFLRHGDEAEEAWENLVARPSTRIVNEFLLSEEDTLTSVAFPESTLAAAYIGESRVHNMI
ncbi:PREDICTED: adenylate isopentenyltransferase 7, mitochondrial-like [Tarenaya hassleriana]|uniref:adenylate isopentenyltransferase 7, mitochondrial-like n=1 Tax=Tarenaya hassleriana TaxID=28532 RepID=UPI0008FD4F40|nr:PREDICTED: adenylate isopentenyltransferase 7, mitochondrial-like [Tarenaya hassleriana]